MIVVTGATGQLGRLVIENLLQALPADGIVAAVRRPGKAGDLAALGVQVREADYGKPATLASAFAGAQKVLLISSSEVGKRAAQHQAVIDSAKAAGVGLLAYTSVLHADTTPLALGVEHRQTEAALAASGLPHVLLRNGWYTENYAAGIPSALARGAFIGAAGDGRISSAARADYAAAAAAVLRSEDQAGRIYELAGDSSYTLAEFAAEVARQSGKPVEYRNLSETDYVAELVGAGVPEGFAGILADSDSGVAKGALYDGSRQLSRLIGRPTTPMENLIAAKLAA